MPKALTVSRIREGIVGHVGIAGGDGKPSTAMLGRMFHELFARLITDESPTGPRALLTQADATLQCWQESLIAYAYRHVVAPQLEQTAAQLSDAGEQACCFWEAAENLCRWLAELWWEVHRQKGTLESADFSVTCEAELSLTLREPGWNDDVILRGTADAILRVADRAWCVAEFKLGRTSPEADLAQAALYHLILGRSAAASPADAAGSLAVVAFKPQRDERVFSADELAEALARLKSLIGRTAGVIGEAAAEGRRANITRRESDESTRSEKPGFAALSKDEESRSVELISCLASLGVEASLDGQPIVGPAFIRYWIRLKGRTRFAAVQRVQVDLSLKMRLKDQAAISLEAGRIAIDIPRSTRSIVDFASLREHLPPLDAVFGNAKMLVGVGLDGSCVFNDFAESEGCHLLVGGTTGSGKSEWLRSALASLMETNTPETLQLVLIDPKRNAFHYWKNSPFRRVPIVFPDETSVVEVLESLVQEMADRYRRFEGVDSLVELVRREGRPTPRILCVCDEYYDLIAADSKVRKEIERLFGRLGAKARAAGIHLIVATQRPSTDVISGVIRANLPGRIGLLVDNHVNARLIETPGAEQLLGKGDLLYRTIGTPKRLQSPLVGKEDLRTCAQAQTLSEAR